MSFEIDCCSFNDPFTFLDRNRPLSELLVSAATCYMRVPSPMPLRKGTRPTNRSSRILKRWSGGQGGQTWLQKIHTETKKWKQTIAHMPLLVLFFFFSKLFFPTVGFHRLLKVDYSGSERTVHSLPPFARFRRQAIATALRRRRDMWLDWSSGDVLLV